jgi:hypothetical protein
MPQGGNFGGGSLPDTIVGGAELLAGKLTTFSSYTCTQAIATADTASYTYSLDQGIGKNDTITATINVADNSVSKKGNLGPEMVINPRNVVAVTAVAFLCYDCNCNAPMTGTTAFQNTGYGGALSGGTKTWAANSGNAFVSTIIGGSGLNN